MYKYYISFNNNIFRIDQSTNHPERYSHHTWMDTMMDAEDIKNGFREITKEEISENHPEVRV